MSMSNTADLWGSPSARYSDVQKTYEEFIKASTKPLPWCGRRNANGPSADMDKLVGERSRLGGSFSRRPRRLLSPSSTPSPLSLGASNAYLPPEQSRAFVRGFQPDLWSRISQRGCSLSFLTNFPDDPYDLIEIHEAAQFVLHGTPSTLLTPPSPPIPPAGSTTTSNSTIG